MILVSLPRSSQAASFGNPTTLLSQENPEKPEGKAHALTDSSDLISISPRASSLPAQLSDTHRRSPPRGSRAGSASPAATGTGPHRTARPRAAPAVPERRSGRSSRGSRLSRCLPRRPGTSFGSLPERRFPSPRSSRSVRRSNKGASVPARRRGGREFGSGDRRARRRGEAAGGGGAGAAARGGVDAAGFPGSGTRPAPPRLPLFPPPPWRRNVRGGRVAQKAGGPWRRGRASAAAPASRAGPRGTAPGSGSRSRSPSASSRPARARPLAPSLTNHARGSSSPASAPAERLPGSGRPRERRRQRPPRAPGARALPPRPRALAPPAGGAAPGVPAVPPPGGNAAPRLRLRGEGEGQALIAALW